MFIVFLEIGASIRNLSRSVLFLSPWLSFGLRLVSCPVYDDKADRMSLSTFGPLCEYDL